MVRLGRLVAWVVIIAGVCWRSLMLLGTLSLSFYHLSKSFGYALGIDAAPEAMPGVLCDANHLLLGRGAKERRDMRGRKRISASRSMEG